MGRIARAWGVSIVAWAAVGALGAAALAGALSSSQPSLWLSPKGVVDGKTLDSDEAIELTVHLQADPKQTYDLAVSYGGDTVGTCQSAGAVLETNPQGKSAWTCTFDTAANAGTEALDGTVTFAVSKAGAAVAEAVATLSVRPVETESEESEDESGEASDEKADNHGQCVSRWAHEAKAAGLEGRHYGKFLSSVAQSDCTGADADFSAELRAALAEQEAAEAEDRHDGGPGHSGKNPKEK